LRQEDENDPVQARAVAIAMILWMLWNPLIPAQDQRQTHAPPAEMRVDINRAPIEELLTVPGMTRTWAGRIVRFRPYRSKQDLLDRGVVNSEVYSRIKEYIIAHREKQ
jgi:DNA uptake protein ComE-like DNA-binding protein